LRLPRELRRYQRVTLPHGAVSCEGVDTELRGHVAVMGLGGLFIRTPVVFPKGTVFRVRIRDGEREVEAVCAVRDLQPDGIGVEFVELRGANEVNLKSILQRFAG
jgi:hypothetical protein